MIIVHINPAGIEKIYFQADSELLEDLCLAVWPLVRKELDRLHKRLRKTAKQTVRLIEATR
jgi:hypothetical protein